MNYIIALFKRIDKSRLIRGLGLASILLLASCGGSEDETEKSTTDNNRNMLSAPATNSAIMQAFATGDSSALTDAKILAQHAQYALQKVSHEQHARVSSLYKGVSAEFESTEWSYWIQPLNKFTAQPLIVGDQGSFLASVSVEAGGRSAAYGVNVLSYFKAGKLVSYHPAFKRLLAWLVRGDASATLPNQINVAMAGFPADFDISGFASTGVSTKKVSCDFVTNPACASSAHLLLVGSDLAANPDLEAKIRALLSAGYPIMYVHLKSNWTSESASQVLAGMGMQFGPYGGNYWARDKVTAGRSEAVNLAKSDQFAAVRPTLDRIASDNFNMPYNWTSCANEAGKTFCDHVPEIVKGIHAPLQAWKDQIDNLNRAGKNIFETKNTDVLKYLVLWADVVRRQIRYPMDKISTPAAFEKAYIADGMVAYIRPAAPAQSDLGIFAGQTTSKMTVSNTDETVDVTIPTKAGFTAIGRLAAPGKTVTAELLDAGNAKVAIQVNTHRIGSTRLWDKNEYNRPYYLSSPEILLTARTPLDIVSPYGGTLQLHFENATPWQKIKLRLRGVSKHPFLDLSNGAGDKALFFATLSKAQHEWAEIKLPGIEVHSRADMMLSAINSTVYAGDMTKYLAEVQEFLFEDPYMLAGFTIPNKSITTYVSSACNNLGWDCVNPQIHQMPGTQHINVDRTSSCGSACAGNPFDITNGLNPRGAGESHEIGHNLQYEIHKIYGGQSTEVSNNLFPIHRDWRLTKSSPQNPNAKPSSWFKSAFDMILAARSEQDPIEGAYKRIWSGGGYSVNSGERTAFYQQWVYYWSDRNNSSDIGWDIITLLYMHARLFASTSEPDWQAGRSKLGYSNYIKKPNPSGNDNMLIALSWITNRDHRPTFDMWGIRYSIEASNQVASYGFPVEPAFFYPDVSVGGQAKSSKINMSVPHPVWPY